MEEVLDTLLQILYELQSINQNIATLTEIVQTNSDYV